MKTKQLQFIDCLFRDDLRNIDVAVVTEAGKFSNIFGYFELKEKIAEPGIYVFNKCVFDYYNDVWFKPDAVYNIVNDEDEDITINYYRI